MNEPYPLRRVRDDEAETWMSAIANTYGEDFHDDQRDIERPLLELDRTIAAFDGEEPVGGAAIYSRLVTVPGAVCPVAGVTWVGVAPTHRRRGILTAMMRKQLGELHDSGAESIAMLNASEATIYGRFGYGLASHLTRFRGDKAAMGFLPDVDLGRGTIRLLTREAARPLIERVYDQVRRDSVGWPQRPARFWDMRVHDQPAARDAATALRFAVHTDPGGDVTGYALYRLKRDENDSGDHSEVRLTELAATTREARAAMWRFLLDIDVHPRISFTAASDDPMQHLLRDSAAVRRTVLNNLWVRLVDVDRALAARRYATALDVVLEVDDAFCPWNTGRFRLVAEGDSASCERTRSTPDLRLSVSELGAVYLGGTTLASLAAAGRVEELRAGALARATVAFRGDREPFSPAGTAFPLC